MDTNNNNQLLHTFEKGMDTDTSDAWLESGKYRSARNLRYLTDNGENTGELHSIEGFEEKLISLNDEDVVFYGHEVSVGQYYLNYRRYYKMLAEVREYDIQGREFVTGDLCCYDGSVWRCNVEEGEIVYGGDPFDPTQWYAYHDADELNSDGYTDPAKDAVIGNIIATTQVRNIGIIISVDENSKWRVYTINKDHQNPYSTTLKFGPCETTIGNNYQNKLSLVTRWEDDDNIKLYIADGEHELMIVNLVLELGATVPSTIEQITNNLSLDLLIPEITDIVEGNLKPALVQYSYQLYNRYGIQSTISPVSKIVNIADIINTIPYGIIQDKKSTIGILLRIKININSYNNIKIYRVTYVQNGQDPTIDVICDSKISLDSSSYFNFIDTGDNEITKISVAEYMSNVNLNLIPKTIESKNDYLFASNIEYKNLIYDDWDARSYTTGCYYIHNGSKVWINGVPHGGQNIDYSEVPQDISIEHENWNLSDTYDGNSWTNRNGTAACGEGQNISWKFKLEEEPLDNRIRSHGIIKNSQERLEDLETKRTLRRGEMYRYGIILYDEHGRKSPTKWIADIRVPDQINTLYSTSGDDYSAELCKLINTYGIVDFDGNNNEKLIGYRIGIEFTVNNLPHGCIGYEIVRCNKTILDSSVITQGVVSRLLRPRDESYFDKYDIPSGYITLFPIRFITSSELMPGSGSDYDPDYDDRLLFFSPEVSYQQDDVSLLLKVNRCYIRPLYYCFPNTESNMSSYPGYYNPSACVDAGCWFRYVFNNSYQKNCSFTVNTYDGGGDYDAIGMYLYNEVSGTIDANFLKSDKKAYNPISYIKLYNREGLRTTPLGLYETNTLFFKNGDFDNSNDVYIKDFKEIIPVEYGKFADNNENINILNHSILVDNNTVYKWASPLLYDESQKTDAKNQLKGSNINEAMPRIPIGPTGKSLVFTQERGDNGNGICMLFKLDFDNFYQEDALTHQPIQPGYLIYNTLFMSCVCNIKKNVTPYDGQSLYAKQNNNYLSFGNFLSSQESTIDVFDGDCMLCCYECFSMHTWYHPTLNCHINMCNVYAIPLETQINIEFDHGDRYSKLNANNTSTINRDLNFLLNEATLFVNYYTQQRPMYQYNTAYSMVPNILISTGVSQEDIKNNKYDYRTYYSNIKTNNEAIDSWTQFKSANYLDVDTRYGEITDLRTFKDRLIFWQNKAVGLFSVNERTMLQDQNDYNIILGNGDVLQRYDYITTEYGMKPNQYADAQSNTCLYWWDGYKKEILAYAGQGVVPTGRTNSIHSYLSKVTEESPALAYDDKYHEMLFSINNTESIVFNEVIKAYTAIYGVAFDNKIDFVDRLLLCKPTSVNLWNSHAENTNYMTNVLEYVTNSNPTYTKVYDDMLFECTPDVCDKSIKPLMEFEYNTPLGQTGKITNTECSRRERDFRMRIPRAGKEVTTSGTTVWQEEAIGNRLRGKTMDCKLTVTNKTVPFSLQYIINKFRISWS